jgi:undecaprenyl diphosphate synthase
MLNKIVGLWCREKKKDRSAAAAEIEKLLNIIDQNKLPRHIAIIMDGNGRWAQKRGLPRKFGHRAGVESLRDIVKICSELNIQVLTVYAFSTENWKRPREEIDVLMDLLVEYTVKEIGDLCQNGVRVNPIGRLQELPLSAREALNVAVERTRDNNGLILNLALNYGGRSEIVDAINVIASKIEKRGLKAVRVDEKVVSEHLYTAGQPDPDLLIRPSGDFRISNFLIWQLAYTEFWLTPVMWPEFRRVHLLRALVDFQRRERRFGALKKG